MRVLVVERRVNLKWREIRRAIDQAKRQRRGLKERSGRFVTELADVGRADLHRDAQRNIFVIERLDAGSFLNALFEYATSPNTGEPVS